MEDPVAERREFLKTGAIGLAGGALLAGAAATLDPKTAAAQAAPDNPTSFKYNRLSKDDAAVLLVDHQSGLITLVQDYAPGEFKNNVLALANLAKYFKLPTILTTSFEDGPNGPMVPEIREIFPDAPYIPRPGQINAWDNEDFVKAIEKIGRKQLIIVPA